MLQKIQVFLLLQLALQVFIDLFIHVVILVISGTHVPHTLADEYMLLTDLFVRY